ncbi:hypothetical protein [Acinetobacter puyangensis]
MAFYHNGKVEKKDRVDPVKLMPFEDQPKVFFEDYEQAFMGMVGK